MLTARSGFIRKEKGTKTTLIKLVLHQQLVDVLESESGGESFESCHFGCSPQEKAIATWRHLVTISHLECCMFFSLNFAGDPPFDASEIWAEKRVTGKGIFTYMECLISIIANDGKCK